MGGGGGGGGGEGELCPPGPLLKSLVYLPAVIEHNQSPQAGVELSTKPSEA